MEHESTASGIDLRRYIRIALANAWIVVLLMALLAGAAYVHATSQKDMYESTALVRVFDPNATGIDAAPGAGGARVDPTREVQIQVLYAQSAQITDDMKKRMGVDASRVTTTSVSGSTDNDTISLSVQSPKKTVARRAAQLYAEIYVQQRRAAIAQRYALQVDKLRSQSMDLQSQIGVLDRQIAALQPANRIVDAFGRPVVVPQSDVVQNLDSQRSAMVNKYTDLVTQASAGEVAATNAQSGVTIVQTASDPTDPVSPLPKRDAAIGAAVGFLLGLGLVALRLRLRQRIVRVEEFTAAAPSVRVLATIPPNRRFARWRRRRPTVDVTSPVGQLPEAYRALRANLLFAPRAEPLDVILVTSAVPNEGKTTTAANLAVTLAQSGQRVIVVDADLRRSRIHEPFGVSNAVGFSSVVSGSAEARAAIQHVDIGGTRLDVLPAGPVPPSPGDLLLSPTTARIISELREEYDHVVIDSPPLLPVADAMTLGWLVDGVLLVARSRVTKTSEIDLARLRLRQVAAPLLGAVLVGVRGGSVSARYYEKMPSPAHAPAAEPASSEGDADDEATTQQLAEAEPLGPGS